MNIARHLIAVSIITLFLASGPVSAQEFRVLYLTPPADAPDTLFLFDGKSTTEVDIPNLNLSRPYDLPDGTRKIWLLAAPPVDPEEIPEKTPSAIIPENIGDFYLILTNDSANKQIPLQLRIVGADPGNFPQGGMLWFNLTENSIKGKLGEQTLSMGPNSSKVIPAPLSKTGNYKVGIAYRSASQERYWPICMTTWQHDQKSRSLGFVIQPTRGQTPRIQVFKDFTQPEIEENP